MLPHEKLVFRWKITIFLRFIAYFMQISGCMSRVHANFRFYPSQMYSWVSVLTAFRPQLPSYRMLPHEILLFCWKTTIFRRFIAYFMQISVCRRRQGTRLSPMLSISYVLGVSALTVFRPQQPNYRLTSSVKKRHDFFVDSSPSLCKFRFVGTWYTRI